MNGEPPFAKWVLLKSSRFISDNVCDYNFLSEHKGCAKHENAGFDIDDNWHIKKKFSHNATPWNGWTMLLCLLQMSARTTRHGIHGIMKHRENTSRSLLLLCGCKCCHITGLSRKYVLECKPLMLYFRFPWTISWPNRRRQYNSKMFWERNQWSQALHMKAVSFKSKAPVVWSVSTVPYIDVALWY